MNINFFNEIKTDNADGLIIKGKEYFSELEYLPGFDAEGALFNLKNVKYTGI